MAPTRCRAARCRRVVQCGSIPPGTNVGEGGSVTGSFADLRAEAAARDARDPLAPFRARFYRRPGVIYLDGNSLGLASKDAEAAITAAVEDWKRYGIDGWLGGDRPWFTV